jgi:Putative lumazine-binding
MKQLWVLFALATAPFFATAQSDNSDLAAVQETLRWYMDGGTNGDSVMFSRAFWPDGQMIYINKGQTTVVPLRDFTARVKNGGPKQERKTRIVSLHVEGNAAQAHLEIETPKVIFKDFMHLLKTDSGWKIVNKVFYRIDKEE